MNLQTRQAASATPTHYRTHARIIASVIQPDAISIPVRELRRLVADMVD